MHVYACPRVHIQPYFLLASYPAPQSNAPPFPLSSLLFQFFITYERQPHLNNVYTVFGKVIGGWETLDLMERLENGKKDRPVNPPVIEKVIIHANPLADQGIVYMDASGPPTVT